MTGAKQLSLFSAEPAPEDTRAIVRPVGHDAATAALANQLPSGLRMGTSSWSFPGWSGLVYEGDHSATRLSRHGLTAYSAHPLFRTVGLDRTYYGPIDAEAFARIARQVPGDFRFLVKAHEYLTLRQFPSHRRYGRRAGKPNPFFLDASYANSEVIAPAVDGLGDKLGVLLLQFAPQNLGRAFPFAERLTRFLSRLPSDVHVSVEPRTRSILGREYVECLERTGASHTLVVHPSMPSVTTQFALVRHLEGPVVIRWMLRPDRHYVEAREEFAPFDRLAAPDVGTRRELVEIIEACAASRREILLIANNKAEGSSPLSLACLARALVEAGG